MSVVGVVNGAGGAGGAGEVVVVCSKRGLMFGRRGGGRHSCLAAAPQHQKSCSVAVPNSRGGRVGRCGRDLDETTI